jgi:colicin import membrane protein
MVDFLKQHWQYIIGALLLHALFAGIFGLTMLNLQRTPPPVQLAIQAVVVDPKALNQASRQQQQRRERERAQQQEREQQAQREREQAAEQQKREQEEATRKQQEETARQEAEQRAEQERQVELKQRQEAEQRRQAEEQQLRERQEAEKKRAAAEAEKKRQAEAKRLAEIKRKQQEEAERRKAADEKRLQEARENDLQRQLQEEEANAAAASSPEGAQYIAMIRQAVQRRWKRPLSARDDLQCSVAVRQTPAGVVLSVKVGTCNGDAAVRQSVENAVYGASPLPTPSNTRLWQANIEFIFRPGA